MKNNFKIISYSERGLMNTILFTIANNREDVELFLRLITNNNYLTISKDYQIIIEHSLSRYGTPDTIIIADCVIYFIEYKVAAHRKNWTLLYEYNNREKHSSLFYQLKSKKMFFEDIVTKSENITPQKNIGKNKTIQKLVSYIQNKQCKQARYIAIIPNTTNIEAVKDAEYNFIEYVVWRNIRDLYIDNTLITCNFEHNNGQIF